MNLKITGHRLKITPNLHDYIQSKLDRIIRHSDQVTHISVLLSINNTKEKIKRQHAEIRLQLKGKEIFIETTDTNLYIAIDHLIDRLDRQVVKYMEKVQKHRAPPLEFLEMA